MLKSKKTVIGTFLLVAMFTLVACGSNNNEAKPNDSKNTDSQSSSEQQSNDDEMNHEEMDMDHSGSGEVPEGLEEAKNPKYEVGSKAIIESNHMKGMKGAEATIVGAFDTIAYTISYTPTTGGEKVTNHKWVIQEEIKEAKDDKPLEPGTEVTVEASHMKGMEGATAKIDSAEKTTVYMVDYMPTTGGEKVTNHKWVTEDELSPVE
ncbi:YdhK family protein [Virgibacillus sp. 179-BFC.A HS]|uniref:YdhK family protein n=1 Tax=Tigheibacillus jepli TaxID=3035914 RepID=A0ABU5CMZ9_9BACI|nr:YdhK family protein [Virgibacillus sp. 179-BFC.A HS]MDY0407174.1 YdhK family protein [Virgibacillus sp. 179-BFC.A HS]